MPIKNTSIMKYLVCVLFVFLCFKLFNKIGISVPISVLFSVSIGIVLYYAVVYIVKIMTRVSQKEADDVMNMMKNVNSMLMGDVEKMAIDICNSNFCEIVKGPSKAEHKFMHLGGSLSDFFKKYASLKIVNGEELLDLSVESKTEFKQLVAIGKSSNGYIYSKIGEDTVIEIDDDGNDATFVSVYHWIVFYYRLLKE